MLAHPNQSSHPSGPVSDVEILLLKTFLKESGFSSASHEKKQSQKLLIQCQLLDYARLALRLHPRGGGARGSSSRGVDV